MALPELLLRRSSGALPHFSHRSSLLFQGRQCYEPCSIFLQSGLSSPWWAIDDSSFRSSILWYPKSSGVMTSFTRSPKLGSDPPCFMLSGSAKISFLASGVLTFDGTFSPIETPAFCRIKLSILHSAG